ncbi:TPA: hypothetical protein JAX37_004587 [Enterobacter cloacae]|nr:hypothetical protein [Enterobacter cloacae]
MNTDFDKLSNDMLEELAAIEHERWSRWQSYLHDKCIKNEDGSLTIPHEYVVRWHDQMSKPFSQLSEKEKQSDRELIYESRKRLKKIFSIIINHR